LPNKIYYSFVAVAIIGIATAIYHAYDEIVNYSTPVSQKCSINAQISCQAVFSFSHPFGIPLYVFGIVWFPLVMVVALLMRPKINRTYMILLLTIGNLFTLYLWYFDIFVVYPAVHAFCPVCLSMYFMNYVLTILAALSSG
jgi:uncharacterized membrane protein